MTTNFMLPLDGRIYELQAQRISQSDLLETWRIWNRGDQTTFVTLTNDRPRLQSIQQYRAPYKWTIEESHPIFKTMVPQITAYLEYYIKGFWKKPFNTKDPAPAGAHSSHVKLFL